MLIMEDNARPPFSTEAARAILRTRYAIEPASLHALPAELDRNFQARSRQGEQFILKIAHSSVSPAVLDLQNQTLRHLRQALVPVPQLLPAQDGSLVSRVAAADGQTYRARLLRYIDGIPLCDFRPHSDSLLADIGKRLGQLSARMQSFQHDEKRRHYRWNICQLPAVAAYATDLEPAKRHLLDHFLRLYASELAPALPSLRHSFIYNDPNDSNILVHASKAATPQVAGFLDFGDMVYAPAVADLAIALAYSMMGKQRPLEQTTPLVRAYHQAFPLNEAEIRLLYPMIAARLCLSVCISAYQQQRAPSNRHLSVSEAGAWALLSKLRDIHPRFAHYHFRAACDLPACPGSPVIVDWLRARSFAPVLGKELNAKNAKILDLGMTSPLLADVADLADPAGYHEPLRRQLGDERVGIGRYSETRPIYLADMFAIDHHARRSLHLGVDLFAAPGEPIYAPLPGTVHSLADKAGEQDYGPTLILKHEPAAGIRFFTLYGHLSPDSLDRWRAGQAVDAGALLAHIGDFPRNGNWTPHLHFQLIVDLLDHGDTFPGVCSPKQGPLWTSLCPDPNLILGLPFSLKPPPASSRSKLVARRRARLNPALSLSYREPLKLVRGAGANLYDEDGQPYLDCVNNVAHVGHGHPRVLRAARRQLALLNTNTRYLHDCIVDYAEALSATLPDPLSVCFFVNSGSEANELALRLARACAGGDHFIVIDQAYHGHTSALIDISPYKFDGPGGAGKPAHVEVARMPDGFRGTKRGFDAAAGAYYARSVDRQIDKIQARGARLAAFVAEGIMACGGQMPLPAGYLGRAFASVREAGGLCIADEVQTGFGRVGSHFWAFELSGVVPDIVTMGKPMGNGHPLGAVVTTPEIAAAFDKGMEYFNTFGGNPVSCAIGLEVLRVIQDEGLRQKASETGDYWLGRLRELGRRYPIIGQARGAGMFLGVELVRDRATLAPADWETAYIVERMKELGVLVSSEGPLGNVLKLKPPLVFGRVEVDRFMQALAEVLGDTVLQME